MIGVHVVASERDPNTFYAVWMDTLSGFLDGSGKYLMNFTKTTDGAQTWQPARVIARVDPLPNTYPRQSFRNLSLPIMAAGKRGELYVVVLRLHAGDRSRIRRSTGSRRTSS